MSLSQRLNRIHTVQEMEAHLRDQLVIGVATVQDVQALLSRHRVNYGTLRSLTQEAVEEPRFVKVGLTSKSFDSYIECRVRAPRTRVTRKGLSLFQWAKEWLLARIVSWVYLISFCFKDGILVEIVVDKQGIGF